MITLSNEQLQTVFNKKALTQTGRNEILTLTLNAMMHSERTAYLQANQDPQNKVNGYRPVKIRG
jgi:putative transposase